MSIRRQILFSHLWMIFLVSGATGLAGYFLLLNYSSDNQQKSLEKSVKIEAEQINRRINDKAVLLKKISKSNRVQAYCSTVEETTLREYLVSFKDEFSLLSYVGEKGLEEVKALEGKVSQDYRNLAGTFVFQEAMRHPNEVVINKKVHDPLSKRIGIQFGIVNRNYFGDEFIGMILGEIPLAEFFKETIQKVVGKTGFFAIINHNGIVLASSRPDRILTPVFGNKEKADGLITRAVEMEKGIGRTDIFGIDGHVAYFPIKAMKWSVLAVLPHKEFMKTPHNFRDFFIVTVLGAFCIGWILSSFLSRRIIRPIIQLTTETHAVAKGNLDRIIDVHAKGEIGQLLHSFNSMTHNLQNITVSRDYMETVINTMMGCLMVLSPDGRITMVNKATLEMLGYSENELMDRSCETIIDDDISFIGNTIKCSLKAENIKNIELHYRAKDGRQIPVLFSVSAICDADGAPQDIVCAAMDIRKQKQSEEKLKNAHQKLKDAQTQLIQSAKLASIGELTAGVAHEMNQPLTVIRGMAQITAKGLQSSSINVEKLSEFLDAIIQNTKRVMNIISHLKTFSRQSKGQYTSVNINAVIDDSLSMITQQLTLRDIEIEKDFDADLPEIFGDPNQLEQVCINLITNARDAMGENGKLHITSRADGNMVELQFKDTGSGIPLEAREKIFDPFFTTKEVGQGTGLGLSISYGIIKEHKGVMEVAETGEEGTTFLIKLPIVSDPS